MPSLTAPGLSASETGAPAQGSRRRRLWELEGHLHCAVLGVCLPIAALRRLVDKALGGQAVADDYELHCGTVVDCKFRGPVAQAVQRELDRRYMRTLKQAAAMKTTEALAAWWNDARCQDIAGPLWATLTHARCTPALAQHVEGGVHMLQHQAGMAARVDFDRFEALLDENAVLSRELGAAQQRSTHQASEQSRRIESQQGEILRLRAQLIGRDTAIAALGEDLRVLEAAAPGLRNRVELARECERLLERQHESQRLLLQSQQEAERWRRRADDLAAELHGRDALSIDANEADRAGEEPLARLDDRAVLCVGGRPASVPIYRQLIERTGGRFLHHDGGEEDNPTMLDTTLAAADLVICQTGCISHDAYWRVKDHCKRTGKRCVFVESPSSSGVKRALLALA
ncbi:DUF2325 domain-containing protein [Ramlibacter sp. WS9]|nr:DUF2325 domain-containing protein [Ramlibacter sp. WS9]